MSDTFTGEIRMFAGNFAPQGWAICDGSLLPISSYDSLYALIGTTYGGDGQIYFGLPDLRGRLPVGQGAAPGLSPRAMGDRFGVETVALTTQQTPAHTHTFSASTALGTSANPDGLLFAVSGKDDAGDEIYLNPPGGVQLKIMNQNTVQNAGASQAHNNLMSGVALNYIICLDGIFPPQR